ncbi:unnamed protein product [Urochloa decumbens]|uniref:FBD domain-containing protein n=1 Tax=Urochloa decumbens TaxID=240449 RepID=A0ABC9FXM9_9POAL
MAGSDCRYCRREQKRRCCSSGDLRHRTSIWRRRIHDADRISALPDDLLLEVLVRLRCAAAAARTSLLGRRWRGLWTRLPELSFHAAAPDPLDAGVAQADLLRPRSSTPPSLLGVHQTCPHAAVVPASVSSWLRAAARLAPAELLIIVRNCRSFGDVIKLPCLDRTISMELHLDGDRVAVPPAGEFRALENLTLSYCDVDLGDLLPRCPRLRRLEIRGGRYLKSITMHSPSLEELILSPSVPIGHVDIVAPGLKKLKYASSSVCPSALKYSGPLLEELDWQCTCQSSTGQFGVRWWLYNMKLACKREEKASLQLNNNHPRVHTMSMLLGVYKRSYGLEEYELGHEMSLVTPFTKFQILELSILTFGHVYGEMVLHLLGLCTFIKKLRVDLREERKTCPADCSCHQPTNWGNITISLTHLTEVDIHGFKGDDHEVEFLKVMFRSAPALERMAVYLACNVSPSNKGCMEIYSISKVYPSVKCNIYHQPDDE